MQLSGSKWSRAQVAARNHFNRELDKAVRHVGRGTHWRSTQGCLFRQCSNWFVSVTPNVGMEKTEVVVHAKPMSIDPILWDILMMSENRTAPLSLRFNGAFACRPPELFRDDVGEDRDVVAVAETIRALGESKARQIETEFTNEQFLQLCGAKNAGFNSYHDCVVCTLITMGQEEDALRIIRNGQASGRSGGFVVGGAGFYDLAYRWITGGRLN